MQIAPSSIYGLHDLDLHRGMEDGINKGYLKDENSRHAINKVPMPCFMAERIHADDAADASADDRNNE